MSAKRLPGKPLLKLNGKSIITHVLNKAKDCKIGNIMVATEDKVILNEVQNNGFKAVLTSKKHKSGTDRIWEAFQKVRDKKIKYIINLQGDEPLIDKKDVRNLNQIVKKNKLDISTLAIKIKNKKVLNNKNIVKVKTEKDLKKIKFSKALKFFRDCSKQNTINLFQHIGIYQYKMSTLSKYVNLKQSKNELKYSLEQYRAIDNNIFIDVVLAKKMSIGIDTMDEYVEIKKIMEYKS